MANALPLLLAGGAALVLLGGKKKKPAAAGSSQIEMEEEDEASDEETDEGEGPQPEEETTEGPGYGIVASGIRKDKRGHHAWRIRYKEDGYHAQTTMSAHKTSPVTDEVGVAAAVAAAQGLLRDYFNELLLEKYPNEQPKSDPAVSQVAAVSGIKLA